ncbi:MAG: hypothetical protein JJT90_17005, partial [Ectothiorhodospiraceae bacterium]|nr:hypothetical protein [Ectothiorhodospiraceae bacterium]
GGGTRPPPRGRHFAGGPRGGVAGARLLVTEATLWILDEPFTALDREGVQLIEQLIAWHLQRGGMTVMTSHQPLQLLQGRVDTLNLLA